KNYLYYLPLFFAIPNTLVYFLPDNAKITFLNFDNGQNNFEMFFASQKEDFEQLSEDVESSSVIPGPENFYLEKLPKTSFKHLYVDQLDIKIDLDEKLDQELHLHFEKLKSLLQTKLQMSGTTPENKFEYIKKSLKVLKKELEYRGNLVVSYKSENARQELQFLMEENGLTELGDRLQYVFGKLDEGFYYKNEHIFVLSEGDFFSVKKKKTKQIKASNRDLFAEQLATLKINDYVIHRDYGIGVYQ